MKNPGNTYQDIAKIINDRDFELCSIAEDINTNIKDPEFDTGYNFQNMVFTVSSLNINNVAYIVTFITVSIATNRYKIIKYIDWTKTKFPYLDLPLLAFIFQKKKAFKYYINQGKEFDLMEIILFGPFQKYNTDEKINIIKNIFFDAMLLNLPEKLNILFSGIFSKENEKSPINNLKLPLHICKIIYNYIVYEININIKRWEYIETRYEEFSGLITKPVVDNFQHMEKNIINSKTYGSEEPTIYELSITELNILMRNRLSKRFLCFC